MNKLKILSIAIFCLVGTLWSDAKCTDKIDRLEQQIFHLNETVAELNSLVPPIGAIIEYSGVNPPHSVNWLECNGQAVNRLAYPLLLNVIGVTYGMGDGLNTFNIPDRRGYVAVGIGTDPITLAAGTTGGRVTNATAPNIVLSGTFGAETHTLTVPEMPPHSHTVGDGANSYGLGNVAHPIKTTGLNVISGITGGGNAHNNMQPGIFMKFYIRAK